MLDFTFDAIDEQKKTDQNSEMPAEWTSTLPARPKYSEIESEGEKDYKSGEELIEDQPDLEKPSLDELEQLRNAKLKNTPSEEKKELEKHRDEEMFYKREKHVFILTWAGRPVYSRYGDETDLASFMGVISTIINIVNVNQKDDIRCVIAGSHKFVFLVKGPVYLLCVTRTHETVLQLRIQLEYIYEQLTGILTSGVFEILNQRAQYDMRSLIGPTDRTLIDNLILKLNSSPAYLLHAFMPMMVPKAIREEIAQILRQERRSVRKRVKDSWATNLMFGLLMVDGHICNLFQPKKHPFHSQDIILLQHFITASEPFRQSETWTPICLPKFERKGFMYAYVHYINTNISITLVTKDPQSFHHLSEARKRVEIAMTHKSLITHLERCLAVHPFRVASMGISHLLHFVYFNVKRKQYIEPIPLIDSPRTELFRRVQHLHARVHANPDHPIVFERSRRDCLLAKVVPGELEVFMFFNAFSSKKHATAACNRVLVWIHNHYDDLFLLPTYW